MKKNQKGFTLVELIVVIAIAAILSGIAVPTYIAYIDEANKAADMQLASDIGYSIKVASKLPATKIKSGDYVLIGVDGVEKAAGLTSTGDPESYEANSVAEAIYDDFGNLTGSTQVKLKYDKWGEVAAAGAVYDDYKDSSFKDNEGALLKDVQNVTNAFESFINAGGAEFAGVTFNNYMEKLGAVTNTEKANAAALYVAERTSVIEGDAKTDFINAWNRPRTFNTTTGDPQAAVLGLFTDFGNITGSDNTKLGTMGAAAAGYAMGEAMVQYLDKVGGDTSKLPQGYSSLSAWYADQPIYNGEEKEADDVMQNLSDLFALTSAYSAQYNPTAVSTYYNSGQSDKDAKAYIATMSAINESSSLLAGDLSKKEMYSDGTVYNYLIGYITAGQVINSLGDDAKGKIVVIATGAENQPLNTVCYPIDYVQ